MPASYIYVAREGTGTIAEVFKRQAGKRTVWRVYWRSRPALEDFRSLAGAKQAVEQPFRVHGRNIRWTREARMETK